LRRWVAEYKPINQLQKQLAYIQSTADYFYALGEAAYDKKQRDKAVEWLKKAIKTTPTHLKANSLLADILLSQGEHKEARQKLEKLYDEQPNSNEVRYKLAQLLLASAKKGLEKEPYALYERVLALEPNLGDIVKWGEWEQLLKQLKDQEDYDTELKLALNLSQKYPTSRPNWQDDIDQLTKKQLYHSAIKAITNGDKETAVSQLKTLISLSPTYKQASRYLYLADTGLDPIKLKISRRRYRLAFSFLFILVIVGTGGLFWHTKPLPFLPETYMLKEREATEQLAQRLAEIETERKAFNSQLTQARASEQALTKQVAQLEGQRNQFKGERDQLENQLSKARTSEQALTKQVAQLEGQRNQLKGEREQLDKQLAQVRTSEQALSKQVAQLEGQRNQLKEEKEQLDSQLTETRTSEQALTKQVAQLDSQLTQLGISEQRLTKQVAQLEGKRDKLNSQLTKAQKLLEDRKGSIKSFLFSGDYIVIVGTYGSYKSAQDELTRITNEFKKHKDDFPKLKPEIVQNQTTQVWYIKIDGASYSRESAEMLRLWATQKLEVQGAYILRRVKKTYQQ